MIIHSSRLRLLIPITTIAALIVAPQASSAESGPARTFGSLVYPYEALLAGKTGKVEAVFAVDEHGRVIQTTINRSDGAEFSAAVIALGDASVLSVAPTKQGSPAALKAYSLTFEFNEKERRKGAYTLGALSDSAREILRELRKNPASKRFASAGGLGRPLKIISQHAPEYPHALVAQAVAGQAVVEFFIDQAGEVQLPRTVSTTHEAFGYSACECVAGWRFEPPHFSGEATALRVRIPFNFAPPGTSAQ